QEAAAALDELGNAGAHGNQLAHRCATLDLLTGVRDVAHELFRPPARFGGADVAVGEQHELRHRRWRARCRQPETARSPDVRLEAPGPEQLERPGRSW